MSQSTFNFDYQDITVLLAQLLLRVGNDEEVCAAEYYLNFNELCEEYLLSGECYNPTTDTCLCGDTDETLIFQCIQSNL